MRRRAFASILLSILIFFVGYATNASASASRSSYIVILDDSVQAPAQVAEDQLSGRDGELGFVYREALNGYSTELPEQAVEGLRHDPRVRYVIADRHVEPAAIETEDEDNEWIEPEEVSTPIGISRIFAPENKGVDIDGEDDVRADVDVAILDTGVDPTHPDLNVVQRVDCTKAPCVVNSGTAENHGTHVGGIVGALDNGFGVVGVAPGARLWSVKVLTESGAELSWVLAGLDWVATHSEEIEVANMSLGLGGSVAPITEALEQSTKEGIVYVVAAGNQTTDVKERSPANVTRVLTVSAIADYDGAPGGKSPFTCKDYGLDDRLAAFSNYGTGVDVAAPGTCILSTKAGGGYMMKSGTSMASPFVAGAAALLAAKDNPDTEADVDAIQKSIILNGNFGWTDTSGDKVTERLLDVHNESVFSLLSPPTVTVGSTAFTSSGGFELRGTVNPNGLSTTYQFEYVSDSKYNPAAENPYAEGAKAPASPASIGAGSKSLPIAVAQVPTGLAANTTYHYRLVAENAKGVSRSGDQTFTTCKGSEGKCSWFAQTPAAPKVETNYLFEDVSCASATMCMAVGIDRYQWDGFAQSWNGSEWKTRAGFPGEMKAVSCPTTSWCMTVAKSEEKGWQLKWVETLPGSFSWSSEVKSPPKPPSASELRLSDVACSSETACTLVGYVVEAGQAAPYVARWNGSKWTEQTAVLPTEGSAKEAMLSVSCGSASSCLAVGTAAKKPFAERWNGTSWSVQSIPNPSGAAEATLEGISCTSASACVAVGSFKGATGPVKMLSESWNGSAFSVLSNAAPSKEGSAKLRSVSCTSASSCTAVGVLTNDFSLPKWEQPVVQYWNGSAWSNQSAPYPEEKPFSSLAGVSCTSSSACTAVGTGAAKVWWETNPGNVALADRWNGSSWSAQTPAAPKAETNYLFEDVSCASATMCMAVGIDRYQWDGFAQSWNGSEWKTRAGFPGEMKAVSCPTTSWCMTVAKSEEKGWQLKWVETLPGSFSWSSEVKSPPKPPSASEINLADISCSSETACTVVGYVQEAGEFGAYVARWNGTKWSEQVAAYPGVENAKEAMLSVSCASASSCVTVGTAGKKPLVERWNGTSWATQSAPNPSGAAEATLEGVSCASASACVAVGSFKGATGPVKMLSESWSGSAWSVLANAAPSKEGSAKLRSVSCTSASSCTAVGVLTNDFSLPKWEQPVVQYWNGSAWSNQSAPSPEEKPFGSLAGVSCTAAGACTAVGTAAAKAWWESNPGNVALADRWG